MLRRTKTFAVAAVAAATAGLVAPPAQAMAACQVKPLFNVIEFQQTVLITGVYHAPAGAIDVQLTCGVVRYGSTYARTTDAMAGPVAALATTAVVPAGNVSACYEITVTYLDRTTYSDNCP